MKKKKKKVTEKLLRRAWLSFVSTLETCGIEIYLQHEI